MAPLPPSVGEITELTDASKFFSAAIEIDGKAVPIYKVEPPTSVKTTCYVEAEEGKEFKVRFTNEVLTSVVLAAFCRLDGTEVGGYTIERVRAPAVYDGKRVSATTVRPFTFSKLQTTDDADLATSDENAVKNLGTIQIELYRVNVLGTTYATETYKEAKQHVFDERSKKATLSHQAGFGAEKTKVDNGTRTRLHYIDIYGQPWKTLEFKYRSRALLELEGIVEAADPPPREASPAAIASGSGTSPANSRKRNVISVDDSDDEADLRAKIAKLKQENESLRKVKREPVAGGSGVKKEKVVIDLLDDSD